MEAMSAAAAHEEEASVVDTDVWLACAVPLSRLPAVGSQVYYFPHGHAEQCPAPLPAPLPTPHLFPCTVTAVRLAADPGTDEVLAEISLRPGPHRDHHRGGPAYANNAATNTIVYYAKQLTQSDANNGGGFSVPRYCADVIFPKLDFEADPPVQNLLMRDTVGNRWQFRHIYRGTPRRHLLTTGWSRFVNAKLLVAGDTVVFMRRTDGELLIGLRRAPRYPARQQATQTPQHQPRYNARARVQPDKVMEAARLAAEGSPFAVTYYPRLGAGEFVVPRKEVEDALAFIWQPGMQVRMQVMEAEDARRTEWTTGTLKGLHADMWRALEVEWDDSASTSSTKSRFLNAWQLQFVGYPPLLKRLRIPDTTLCPLETTAPPQSYQDDDIIPAALGMQEARHNNGGPTTTPLASAMITTHLLFPSPVEDQSGGAASSEILDPELGSPPTSSRPAVEQPRKSFQLFGATITTHAADEDGCSEEVNNQQVPDA